MNPGRRRWARVCGPGTQREGTRARGIGEAPLGTHRPARRRYALVIRCRSRPRQKRPDARHAGRPVHDSNSWRCGAPNSPGCGTTRNRRRRPTCSRCSIGSNTCAGSTSTPPAPGESIPPVLAGCSRRAAAARLEAVELVLEVGALGPRGGNGGAVRRTDLGPASAGAAPHRYRRTAVARDGRVPSGRWWRRREHAAGHVLWSAPGGGQRCRSRRR